MKKSLWNQQRTHQFGISEEICYHISNGTVAQCLRLYACCLLCIWNTVVVLHCIMVYQSSFPLFIFETSSKTKYFSQNKTSKAKEIKGNWKFDFEAIYQKTKENSLTYNLKLWNYSLDLGMLLPVSWTDLVEWVWMNIKAWHI